MTYLHLRSKNKTKIKRQALSWSHNCVRLIAEKCMCRLRYSVFCAEQLICLKSILASRIQLSVAKALPIIRVGCMSITY